MFVITGAKCEVGSDEAVSIDAADSVVALVMEGSHAELDIASSLDAFGICLTGELTTVHSWNFESYLELQLKRVKIHRFELLEAHSTRMNFREKGFDCFNI
jgi:hypothetical protein